MHRVSIGLAALLLSLTACESDGASVVVDLRTDLVPGVEFVSVRTTLDSPVRVDDRSAVMSDDFVAGERVAELTDVPMGGGRLVVSLIDSAGDEVAARALRIDVAGDTGVTVVVTRDCVDVSCGSSQTCSGGTCVSEFCLEGVSADRCAPSECAAPEECAPMSGCSEARCVDGLCLYAAADGACGDEEYCDVVEGCTIFVAPADSGPPDTSVVDSGSDSAPIDSAVDTSVADTGRPPGCGAMPDGDTVALFRMEDLASGQLTDATGDHHGTFHRMNAPTVVAGPSGCGMAFGGGIDIAGRVPNDPLFDLSAGSVDFWFRPAMLAPTEAWGLVSRDATGDVPGNFTAFYSGEGRLVARLQATDRSQNVCSNGPLPLDEWVHVGINFGPSGPFLFIDGVAQAGTGTWISISRPDEPCVTGVTAVGGTVGTDQIWSIGASTANSGSGVGFLDAFMQGALDEVRISRTPRDFTALGP